MQMTRFTFGKVAVVAAMAFTHSLFAQGLPATDLVELAIVVDDTKVEVTQVKRITDSNGYSSQPMYLPTGDSLYYTAQVGELTQIKRYSRADNQHTQLTYTNTNQYSPTPHGIGQFTAVMGDQQHLVAFDSATGKHQAVTKQTMVGYHAWHRLAKGERLWMAVVETDNDQTVMNLYYQDSTGNIVPSLTSVGRSLKPFGPHLVLMVGGNVVKLNAATGQHQILTALPPKATDIAVDSQGDIWAGNGTKLMRYHNQQWQVAADLSDYAQQQALGVISRIDINPSRTHAVLVFERLAANESSDD